MVARSRSCMTVFVYTFCFLLVVQLPVSLTDGKCGGTLTGKTGDLLSPNFPRTYPSHSRCSWLIQVPVGYKIQLQFYHFVLENTYECGSDVMRIYDGRNSLSVPLGKYCGRKVPFKVESTTTSMFIFFKSDRSVNYRGFKAKFTAVAVDTVREMSFRRTLKNITALLGTEVKFNCQIKDGSVNINFIWTKDGQILSDDPPNYSIKYNAVNKRSHLLLKKVTKSDAGVYQCLVSDGDMGKNLSSYGNLFVKVPAVVREGPTPMTVNVGDNVVIQCKALGDPVPKISWYVNGQNKTSLATKTNVTSKLHLKAVKDAVVNCSADNAFGVDWKTAKITVLLPAVVREGPTPMTVNVGDNVVIQCKALGDPVPKISWYVNGQDKTSLATKTTNVTSKLHLKAVKDAVVNCSADNGFGVDWKTAKITVLPHPTVEVKIIQTTTPQPEWSAPVIVKPPKNVTAELGDNVTLTCAAKGNPKPKIRWLVDDDDKKYYENLPEDENGVSHFTLMLTKDKTSVRCEAQNPKDIDSRTAYITVPKVEALVQADTSGGFFDGTKFILIMAFAALFILVIVGVMLILYRRRNLKLQNLSSPVDLEKLQSNPIFQQHANYYINPKLLSWEVPRYRMEFIKELGQGNGKFSSLFLGKISHASSEEDNEGKVALVMVKLLKEKLEDERENFEQDAIALTTFSHPYVQSLFGVCVDGYPLCLVFEFTEHDENLHQFLIESGRGHCSLHRQADMNNAKPKLSNVDQISISKQIASGMEYLADKGYVHRELCTKNCIIGKGMVVKISNLGFSWKGPNSDYYSLDISERALYPVRWLPLETIQFGWFAEDSDIWSFGVVLWEIYSSGMTPYYGMNEEEVISLVDDGDILPCPKECPKEMYEVMQGCWKMEPSERPRFSSIHQRISSLFNGVPV